jgi:hypothetical protein
MLTGLEAAGVQLLSFAPVTWTITFKAQYLQAGFKPYGESV